MENLTKAYIFLSALGIVIIILVIAYYCVKKELCFCQNGAKCENEEEEENEGLLGALNHNIKDHVHWFPYVTTTVNEQDGGTEFHYVKEHQMDTQTCNIPADDVLPPLSDMDVYTSDESERLSENTAVPVPTNISKEGYIGGCELKVSLLHSMKDSLLMLTVIEMSGMPNKSSGGYDYVRVSITLLAEKKCHKRTKLHFVGTKGLMMFGDSFRFDKVTHQSLPFCSLRFRLYAKISDLLEVNFGEMFVKLSDVANCTGYFVTSNVFQRKKSKFKYLRD